MKNRPGQGYRKQREQSVRRPQGWKELGEFDPHLVPDRGDSLWETPVVERGLIVSPSSPNCPGAGMAPTIAHVVRSQGRVSVSESRHGIGVLGES